MQALRILTLTAIIFVGLYFGLHIARWIIVDTITISQPTEEERAEHRRLLKKHGNYTVYNDGDGKWYFIRNGVKCKWM